MDPKASVLPPTQQRLTFTMHDKKGNRAGDVIVVLFNTQVTSFSKTWFAHTLPQSTDVQRHLTVKVLIAILAFIVAAGLTLTFKITQGRLDRVIFVVHRLKFPFMTDVGRPVTRQNFRQHRHIEPRPRLGTVVNNSKRRKLTCRCRSSPSR